MTEHVFRRVRAGVRDRTYSGRYRLAPGERLRTVSLGTADKRVAVKRLRDLIVEKQLEREGLVTPRAQREAASIPLAQLLAEYKSDLLSRGRSETHAHDTFVRINRALQGTGWRYLADIRPDQFAAWRASLTLAPKTMKEYQAAFSAFLNWLVQLNRLAANPLAKLPKVETRGKQVRKSRAFTGEELQKLCAVAPVSRRLAYLTLAYTGQRRGEVKALVWSDLHLEDVRPFVLVREETTKDKAKRPIPLHPELAAALRTHRQKSAGQLGIRPDQRVFIRFPDYGTLRADLERAGIPHSDATGRVVHFHAFRKTFQTFGVQAGINQRAAQELLGHSDANLTAKVYTDVPSLSLHTEIAKLPWFSWSLPGSLADAKTSVPSSAPSRFLTIVRDLVKLSNDYDLERVAQEIDARKLASPAGFEPAFSP